MSSKPTNNFYFFNSNIFISQTDNLLSPETKFYVNEIKEHDLFTLQVASFEKVCVSDILKLISNNRADPTFWIKILASISDEKLMTLACELAGDFPLLFGENEGAICNNLKSFFSLDLLWIEEKLKMLDCIFQDANFSNLEKDVNCAFSLIKHLEIELYRLNNDKNFVLIAKFFNKLQDYVATYKLESPKKILKTPIYRFNAELIGQPNFTDNFTAHTIVQILSSLSRYSIQHPISTSSNVLKFMNFLRDSKLLCYITPEVFDQFRFNFSDKHLIENGPDVEYLTGRFSTFKSTLDKAGAFKLNAEYRLESYKL